jgi:hypothetical protein
MKASQPETKTDQDALVAAIERALDMESLRTERLTEASFGRFADGSGWYWHLRFATEVGNVASIGTGLPEDRKRRVAEIISAWQRARERYGENAMDGERATGDVH